MEVILEIKPFILYWPNGNTKTKQWIINKIRHRTDGPAIIDYSESGTIQREVWYLNNQYHRDHNPAISWYYESGKIDLKYWYINGKELKNNELIEYKEWLIDNNLYKPYNTWTDEEKVLWRLSWK